MNIIIIIIIAIFLLVLIGYNILVRSRIKVDQAKSGIDVYLKQRFDLIPNLVKTVKGYMEHESDLLNSIVKLRNEYNDNTNDIKTSQELNNQIDKIFALAENYPDLKANEQFLNLQKNLTKMESQLQAARRIYNNEVTKYNTKIQVVPLNIVAKLFGFKEKELFKIDKNEEEVKVKM